MGSAGERAVNAAGGEGGAVYLDHCAAEPLHPDARAILRRLLEDRGAAAWANPASVHAAGREARSVLERAREQVAEAMGAEPTDVVFTSGGTEACQLGVLGLAVGVERVVTTPVEHPAVVRAVERLARRGVQVVRLPLRAGRIPDADAVAERLGAGPSLLAVQWINHETGDRWPLESWLEAARAQGARCFVDASQAFGRVGTPLAALGAHAVAVASSKVGGPAGCGALWVDRSVDLEPQLEGGGQERGRRAGTPSVLLAAGFGAACAALPRRKEAMARVAGLRDRLEGALLDLGARRNTAGGSRAPHVTNVSWEAWRADLLVAALDVRGVRVSAGPACSSGRGEPSPTVSALHPDAPWRALGAVRFSVGVETTEAEVARAVEVVADVVGRGA